MTISAYDRHGSEDVSALSEEQVTEQLDAGDRIESRLSAPKKPRRAKKAAAKTKPNSGPSSNPSTPQTPLSVSARNPHTRGGSLTIFTQKCSRDCITSINLFKSTGFET